MKYSKSEEESESGWGQWGGVAVCTNVGVFGLLFLLSAIGSNGDVAVGKCHGAEAMPECPTDVLCSAGVLGAETVGRKHIETHIAGVGVFLCNILGQLRNSE